MAEIIRFPNAVPPTPEVLFQLARRKQLAAQLRNAAAVISISVVSLVLASTIISAINSLRPISLDHLQRPETVDEVVLIDNMSGARCNLSINTGSLPRPKIC